MNNQSQQGRHAPDSKYALCSKGRIPLQFLAGSLQQNILIFNEYNSGCAVAAAAATAAGAVHPILHHCWVRQALEHSEVVGHYCLDPLNWQFECQAAQA